MRTSTVVINADRNTERASHWLAVQFRPKSSSAYYFDSYGIVPLVPAIQTFIEGNCTTWDYNRRHLQGLTFDVCGMHCYLPSTWIGATLRNNSSHSSMRATQTRRWCDCSLPNSGLNCCVATGVNVAAAAYKI